MTAFAFWKTAHILSAAIIFGTGFGIAFFTWFRYRGLIRSRVISDNFVMPSSAMLRSISSRRSLTPWRTPASAPIAAA